MYAYDLKKQNKNKDWKDFFFSCKFYYYSHLCCAEFPCTLGACCFSMMRLVWCVCVCVCKYCPLGYLCARLQSLTPTFRAVEVFIRDKYERKKYYNKEASATAQVSINNTVCVLQFECMLLLWFHAALPQLEAISCNLSVSGCLVALWLMCLRQKAT